MRESTHAAIGAVIGIMLVKWGTVMGIESAVPELAFFLGIASHLELDTIAHLDPGHYGQPDDQGKAREFPNYTRIQYAAMVIDFIAMFAIIGWLWERGNVSEPVGCAILGAILPDILLLLPRLGIAIVKQKWLSWFHRLHHEVHFRIIWSQRKWCWHNEILILAISLWWLCRR